MTWLYTRYTKCQESRQKSGLDQKADVRKSCL